MPNVTAYNSKMTASFCFHPLKKEALRGANQSSNVPYNSSAPAANIAITVSPKSIHTPPLSFYSLEAKRSVYSKSHHYKRPYNRDAPGF